MILSCVMFTRHEHIFYRELCSRDMRIYFVVSYVHETWAYILSWVMFTRHEHLFYRELCSRDAHIFCRELCSRDMRIYFIVHYVHETCAYILSCIMFTRHAHLFYVILSTFSTRSISLVAANNASVSLFMFYVYVFAKRIIIISPEQILQSLI